VKIAVNWEAMNNKLQMSKTFLFEHSTKTDNNLYNCCILHWFSSQRLFYECSQLKQNPLCSAIKQTSAHCITIRMNNYHGTVVTVCDTSSKSWVDLMIWIRVVMCVCYNWHFNYFAQEVLQHWCVLRGLFFLAWIS